MMSAVPNFDECGEENPSVRCRIPMSEEKQQIAQKQQTQTYNEEDNAPLRNAMWS